MFEAIKYLKKYSDDDKRKIARFSPVTNKYRQVKSSYDSHLTSAIGDVVEEDVMEVSSSPWLSSVFSVAKKDGFTRYCVEYRKLNDIIQKGSLPLLRIDDTLGILSGSAWFSTFGMRN